MQNADSFSQIIMESADSVLTREKRATTPAKRVNAEVLALFATRALWQHAAVRHRPGEAMVTHTSPLRETPCRACHRRQYWLDNGRAAGGG